MSKEEHEIYLKLLKNGYREEEMVTKLIDVGVMLSEKAEKENKNSLDVLAHETFEHAVQLAKGQGFGELEIRAQEYATESAGKMKQKTDK